MICINNLLYVFYYCMVQQHLLSSDRGANNTIAKLVYTYEFYSNINANHSDFEDTMFSSKKNIIIFL